MYLAVLHKRDMERSLAAGHANINQHRSIGPKGCRQVTALGGCRPSPPVKQNLFQLCTMPDVLLAVTSSGPVAPCRMAAQQASTHHHSGCSVATSRCVYAAWLTVWQVSHWAAVLILLAFSQNSM